mgnify:CR=1 FL=1
MPLQTTDKNDLLSRLDAYLRKHHATITVTTFGRTAFEIWLINELIANGRQARSGNIYLRALNRNKFDVLLRSCGITTGIYACTDLNAIKRAFEDLVNNITLAAQDANDYGNGNTVSAFRYFIEFLLDQNRITI